MKPLFSWEAFDQMPVVGILRNMPLQKIETLAGLYLDAGLTTLEVTMNSEGVTAAISSLVKIFGGRLNIGAGTVCTLKDLEKAFTAGAQFIVTPIVSEEVIEECVKREIPVFAGAYTPSEIYRAWHLGAAMVKVFPAGQLGPGYIREVLAPLNHIKLLPTGGISRDNFTDFLASGARGVGMGSHLIPMHLIENNQWEELGKSLQDFVNKYQQFINN